MHRITVLLLLCTAGGAGPSAAGERDGPPVASLTTDSTEYAVRLDRGLYRVAIGYAYVNRTGRPVSANYCREPNPPLLEKAVGDRWLLAYDPIELLCKSNTPFRIRAGATYHGTLRVAVAPRGGHVLPELAVDSVPGTYRLRWVLHAGDDPDDWRAALVETHSNRFRLVSH